MQRDNAEQEAKEGRQTRAKNNTGQEAKGGMQRDNAEQEAKEGRQAIVKCPQCLIEATTVRWYLPPLLPHPSPDRTMNQAGPETKQGMQTRVKNYAGQETKQGRIGRRTTQGRKLSRAE